MCSILIVFQTLYTDLNGNLLDNFNYTVFQVKIKKTITCFLVLSWKRGYRRGYIDSWIY
jgi:hypothetical protein